MPWPLIATLGAGLLGGILGNRKQTATSTNQSQSTSTATPTLDPNADLLNNHITENLINLFHASPNFDDFTTGGYSDINQNYDAQRQSLQGILASRGIQGPAAATANINFEGNRFADALKFKQNAPLLYQSLRLPLLQTAGNFSASLPRGMTTTENTSSSGTGTQPGNMLGGAFGNLANLLAYFYGQGAFRQTPPMQMQTGGPVNV